MKRSFLLILTFLPLLINAQNFTDNNGKKQGFWEEIDKIEIRKGVYSNNEKQGMWLTYDISKNLLLKIENYKDGKKNFGQFEFQNGTIIIAEKHYKNGVLHGLFIENNYQGFHVLKCFYSEGLLDSVLTRYYPESLNKILETISYKKGVKYGYSMWYDEDGKLIAKYNYKNGVLDGVQQTFYNNSFIKTTYNYLNNELNGLYEEFFKDGKTKVKGNYENGKKIGTWLEYDENEKLINKENFNN